MLALHEIDALRDRAHHHTVGPAEATHILNNLEAQVARAAWPALDETARAALQNVLGGPAGMHVGLKRRSAMRTKQAVAFIFEYLRLPRFQCERSGP
jgi:hypothetical protein